jgi:polar amino acid transport system substrate-binding protein
MHSRPLHTRRAVLRGSAAAALAALVGTTAACGSSSDSSAPAAGASGSTIKTVKSGVLSVATMSDAKPNCWIENGVFKGFDLDLARAIGGKLGLTVEFAAIDFPALFPSVAQGRYDMAAASTAGTIERQKIVDFSAGYLGGYLGVLTTKSSGITEDNASTNGKRLGLLQGSIQEAYAKKFLSGATLVMFPDNNAGVSALQTGRVDGYFLDFVVGTDYIEQHPELVQPIAIPAFDQPAAFPIKKGNTALEDGVNKALGELVEDGTWMKLYTQYFSKAPKPKDLPPYPLPAA